MYLGVLNHLEHHKRNTFLELLQAVVYFDLLNLDFKTLNEYCRFLIIR